ncbi:MAG: hypothetical protein J7647_29295 [Cyanobacteria bacterium SBLK]|nr:hypothetical protein [Cyanobacteria bacterium SBLK]
MDVIYNTRAGFYFSDGFGVDSWVCLKTKYRCFKTPDDRYGRWLLTGAILVGAIAGQTIRFNALTIALIWSFLAGSIILNVLTRELPGKSCFLSFLSGMLLYTVLILIV